jgi:hypothetical protein
MHAERSRARVGTKRPAKEQKRAVDTSIPQERVYAFAVRRTRRNISVQNVVDWFIKADEFGSHLLPSSMSVSVASIFGLL